MGLKFLKRLKNVPMIWEKAPEIRGKRKWNKKNAKFTFKDQQSSLNVDAKLGRKRNRLNKVTRGLNKVVRGFKMHYSPVNIAESQTLARQIGLFRKKWARASSRIPLFTNGLRRIVPWDDG